MNKQNIMNRLKGFPLSIEQKQELLSIIEENSGGNSSNVPTIELIMSDTGEPQLITEVGNYVGSVSSSSEESTEIRFKYALDLINYLNDKPNIILRMDEGDGYYIDLSSTMKGTLTTYIHYYFCVQNRITVRLMFFPQNE